MSSETGPTGPNPGSPPAVHLPVPEDPAASEEEEEEEGEQPQGRRLWQSGQRQSRRSRRQAEQTPLGDLSECLQHLHSASSSRKHTEEKEEEAAAARVRRGKGVSAAREREREKEEERSSITATRSQHCLRPPRRLTLPKDRTSASPSPPLAIATAGSHRCPLPRPQSPPAATAALYRGHSRRRQPPLPSPAATVAAGSHRCPLPRPQPPSLVDIVTFQVATAWY
ncbi:putative uncharacterized protein DDB_G0271982 [Zingiber officinale]|uniref:putative uncharacterized protein DDB_G0271982 n=1 Tax=Zingiber officinale TaxID=94328 RepID=UPI001C4B25D3|nr:putative uncharacterized protein DDB_G0271982 [Zingiber officinale]